MDGDRYYVHAWGRSVISIEQKQEYFDFINETLNVCFEPKSCVCISSLGENGTILGVVVFDRFTETGVELSVASVSPKFLSRRFLDVVFHYAFVTAQKNRVTSVIECDNTAAIKLNKGLGFIEEGVLKEWYGKKDGIILRMLKSECKWMKKCETLTT
jgi:RimJ/RimL family protein N-acetyltransferase